MAANGIALLVFQLIVLIFSVVVHEVSHGVIAEKLGDPTARVLGRLTLNPLKHLDPFGSVILPILLYVLSGGSFVVGWAKPVPYNPAHLKDPSRDGGKIAAAGPVANLVLAAVFGVFLRVASAAGANGQFLAVLGLVVYMNVLLAVFNLVPIPPLDGSKVLFALLPATNAGRRVEIFLERYGIILLFAFLFFGIEFLLPVIKLIFTIFTGSNF